MKDTMDEDDDLYGGTGDDAQGTEQRPDIKAENEVDMDGDQEEEDEESDDVWIHSYNDVGKHTLILACRTCNSRLRNPKAQSPQLQRRSQSFSSRLTPSHSPLMSE